MTEGMTSYYQLLSLYVDFGEIARATEQQIMADLTSLSIDRGRVEILHNPLAGSVKKEVPSVALFVGSVKAKADAEVVNLVNELVAANIPILPIVPRGESFSEVIPEALHPINALTWESATAGQKVSARLLRILGLTEKQRRVFVSYRRSDALLMGEQIWEELTKAGFDVFLDRFGIDPAENFQERLADRLGDKAFVLLIESPEASESKWVLHEVNYARKHQLGFLAVTWPATKTQNRFVDGIFEKYRHYLSDSDLKLRGGQTVLKDEFFTHLAALVEQRHAAAMLRRRRDMLGSIIQELRRKALPFTQLTDWTLVVEKSTGHRLVSVTPRPPEIPDLFYLDAHASGYNRAPLEFSWLIHSTARFHGDRRTLLDWAVSGRKLGIESADKIVELVDTLASTS
jgi:hypothetical protein